MRRNVASVLITTLQDTLSRNISDEILLQRIVIYSIVYYKSCILFKRIIDSPMGVIAQGRVVSLPKVPLSFAKRCVCVGRNPKRLYASVVKGSSSEISEKRIVAESSTTTRKTSKKTQKKAPRKKSEANSLRRLVSRSSDGRRVVSTKRYEKDTVHVTIEAELLCKNEGDIEVLWGVYRASPDAWQFPKAVEVQGSSSMDDSVGAMCTTMQRQDDETSSSSSSVVSFQIPQKVSPLTLAYALRLSDGSVVTPSKGDHFTVQIGIDSGKASVLGAHVSEQNMLNFAVECRGADYVNLVLVFEDEQGGFSVQDVALDPLLNRTGTVWHASIPYTKDIDAFVGYGWRVTGDLGWEQGYRVSPDAVLLDPEASGILFVEPCDALAAFPHIRSRDETTVVGLSRLSSMKSCSLEHRKAKDAANIGYGMLSLDPQTFGHDNSHVQHPGTFLGISEAADYFVSLGVTSIVLRKPYVIDTADTRSVTYFAPDPTLASSPRDAEKEFQGMVNTLHKVGIEVLITFDLTLTAEGSDEHPNPLSWRGLDNANYYRANGVLDCGNPVMQEHIIRALRHWTLAFGVDGFEFLYAENMVQNMDDVVMDAPALPDALCHDPILSGSKLIASPHTFELLPRQGERGFPHWGRWRESNGDKGVVLEYFLAPPTSREPAVLQKVAAVAAGRPHLFAPAYHGFPGNLSSKRPIGYSINDLDSSGWTDSVISTAASAARALMLTEGQQENIPTTASLTRAIIATNIFSSGTPSFPVESISEETEDFIRNCLTCRPILAGILDSGSVGTWHAISGHTVSLDSLSNDTFFLGRQVSSQLGTIYIAMNPEYYPLTVTLPSVNGMWKRVVDSYSGSVAPAGMALQESVYSVPAKSFALFIAHSQANH